MENVGTRLNSDGALILNDVVAIDFLLKDMLARLDARDARLRPSTTHDGKELGGSSAGSFIGGTR